jgi:L-ascorbate metabolism protein UlaG (beta-lactamase superfamily)
MKVTYFGHSAFLVEVDGAKILIDPFLTGNPLNTADPASLKPDLILVSHGHGDHTGDAEDIAKNSGAPILSNYEIATWFEKRGVEKTIGINLGGTAELPFGKVQMVPAWHSSTLPDGGNGGTAGGFIITHKGGTFYFSGDTALFAEMKLFARRQKIDAAFLCLGGHFTMDAVDAVHAADFLGCDTIVGMHFDTFDPIKIDRTATEKLFKDAGKNLRLPKPGEVFTI